MSTIKELITEAAGSEKNLRRYFVISIIILALIFISSVFYTVEADSVGVVWTLGKITDETSPGIHFKIPLIQTVNVIPTRQVLRREIGYATTQAGQQDRPAQYRTIPDQQRMLTGDENIAFVDFTVQYRIADASAYLLNTQNPISTLDKAAEAAMRLVVGEDPIDMVLTDGKAEIQAAAKDVLQQIINGYGLGILVQSIQLQDVAVPHEVQPAFKAVVDAKEEKETKINQALRHENTVIPRANGEAEQMIQSASAYKEQRTEGAIGDVARFAAILEEYTKSKATTKTRLYFEMIRETLPNVHSIYITKDGDALKLLQIGGGM
ncbi:MAG: FtsH protease activity modulator HflK [Bacillota bacterium]|nr:FtsH protease activity modulator HflK [Bacillota bacterium]